MVSVLSFATPRVKSLDGSRLLDSEGNEFLEFRKKIRRTLRKFHSCRLLQSEGVVR